ncbi:hypothetical protein AYK26_03195 [Euryarchaeota archaeon SM23-78]|nr:MAG: hypothetical protein AYK26_03195 [Euryarchaeota archaeon SM23-78]
MKLKVLSRTGNALGQVDLPAQFLEPIREDLIKKAVLAIQNNKRQAYGAYEEAGKRHSVQLSKRRRAFRGSYGHGISRIPRKILSKRGRQFYWVGAFAPGTVGGRKAHPPKAVKKWGWKLNTKERRKAIRSAMSATMDKELVMRRGHKVPDTYPFILEEGLEKTIKTKDLLGILTKLGFKEELIRTDSTKMRAGKGKRRSRRKVTKKGALLVVSDAKQLRQAAKNIPGIEVTNVNRLNTEMLAPGGHPGRATIFTTKAVEVLKTGLFTKDYQGEPQKKERKKKKEKPKKVEKKKERKVRKEKAVKKSQSSKSSGKLEATPQTKEKKKPEAKKKTKSEAKK